MIHPQENPPVYNTPSDEELNKIQMQFKMQFKKLYPDAKAPEKAYPNDLGWDLFANMEMEIPPNTHELIPTGISLKFPENTGALLKDRSSVAMNGVFVHAGVIDPNYTGEIKVLLYNSNNESVVISKDAKIAQFLLMPVFVVSSFEEVVELDPTDRGNKGFGSSDTL